MRRDRFRLGLSVALFSIVLSGYNSNDVMAADTNSEADVQQTEVSKKSNEVTIRETEFGKVQGLVKTVSING